MFSGSTYYAGPVTADDNVLPSLSNIPVSKIYVNYVGCPESFETVSISQ